MNHRQLLELYVDDLRSPVMFSNKKRPKSWQWSKFAKFGKFILENQNSAMNLDDLGDRKLWIWSDQHFHHKNIIKYSDRPFKSVDSMHQAMLERHNDLVDKDDVVIWLGDVGFASDHVLNNMLKCYNGYKILIFGNHDLNHEHLRLLEFDEIYAAYSMEKYRILLTHYPLDNVPEGYYNVHGHVHAKSFDVNIFHSEYFNVCCEFHNYAPILFSTIINSIKETDDGDYNKRRSGVPE